MQKNSLWQNGRTIFRVLDIAENRVLVIDCIKRTMPQWMDAATMEQFYPATEEELQARSQVELFDIDSLDAASKHITFKNRPECNEPFRKFITRTWSNMVSRATNPKIKERYPRYLDTTIDPDLQKSSKLFGQWYFDTYYDYPEKVEVDKDILGLGETNRYQIGLIALVPNHLNKIFIKGKSELGYSIYQKVSADGKKYYKIFGNVFTYDGFTPKDVYCDTYIEALQTARKMKADYLRRIAAKERADGHIPENILNAIEKWANRCELGMVKLWEPSEDTLRRMDII